MKNLQSMVVPLGVSICLLLAFGCSKEPEATNVLISEMQPVSLPDQSSPTGFAEEEESKPQRPIPSDTGPWPTAVAEDMLYEFGKMSIGTELEHIFTIKNEGEADLELVPGKATCKCTAFAVSNATVKPGESTELTVRWKGKFKDSMFQHGGPVYTNDPEKPELKFAVKGVVDANLDVLPEEMWSVGEVVGNEPGTTSGVVLSRVHESFSITEMKCESPHVSFESVPLTADQLSSYDAVSGFSVKVSVDAAMPPGPLEEKLSISVDIDKAPITVTVAANKPGPIRILPLPGVQWEKSSHTLRLGQFSSKKGREASVMLLVEESEGDEPLEFTDVDTSPSYLATSLERLGSVGTTKARYRLTVKVPPGVPQTQRDSGNPGTMNLTTNHPSGQVLKLKVLFKTGF